MTNEQLVNRIQAGVDVADNMLKLWEQNKGLIGKIAGKYRSYAEEEDLKQEGYFALCEAVEHWDAARGGSFSTVLFQYLRSVMLRYCQNNGTIRLPVEAGGQVRQYERLLVFFQQETGRKPTDREICYYLQVSMKTLARIRKAARMNKIGSLDTPVNEEDDATLCDVVAAPGSLEGDVLEELQAEQLKATIWPLVDALTGKQAEVIRARYREGLTLKEAGERIGTNTEGARQYQMKALRELRKPSRARYLRPFLYDDGIYNRALKGCGAGNFNRTWTSSTERVALGLD